MTHDLDRLMRELGGAPLDRSLDDLPDDLRQRLIETAATNAQTWRLRAAAAAVIALTGVAVSATSTAAAATETESPFAAWSRLAPSTLLEANK